MQRKLGMFRETVRPNLGQPVDDRRGTALDACDRVLDSRIEAVVRVEAMIGQVKRAGAKVLFQTRH